MTNKGQQQQHVDLFNSDDDYNEDDDHHEDQLQACINYIIQILQVKPYEENLTKFNKWYNEFFTKTSQFEDRRRIHHGIPDYQTVQISCMATERKIGIFDIISSKYKNINKIAITFIYLDLEIQKIKEVFSQKLNNVIMLYGERPEQDQEEVILKEGQAETEISRIFGTFRQMYDLVKRLMAIIYNIINQLNNIYNKKDMRFYGVFKNIDLFFALDSIGHALQIIYTLDCIVNDNENLQNHWNQYKKMIKIVKNEPEKYGTTAQSIKQLDKMLARQEKTVMSGQCTQGVLQSELDANAQLTSNALKNGTQQIMGKNKELMEFFRNYFKNKLQILNQILGTSQETNERDQIMPMLGVYALFRRIYPSEEERKTYKQMWSLQKKVPVIEGHVHVLIYVFKYLTDVCPLQKKSDGLDPKNPVENVMQYIKQLDATIEQQVNQNYSFFCTWISRMDSIITSNPSLFGEGSMNTSKESNTEIINERLNQRIKLILNGILIAQQIRNLIHNSVLLHLSQQIVMPPSTIKSIKTSIEILKAINFMFNQKAEAFNPTYLNKFITKSILHLLSDKISQQKKIDEGQKKKDREEIIGSLSMMLIILRHPLNNISLLSLNFLLNIVNSKGVLTLEEFEDLQYVIWKLQQINRFQYIVQQSTCCQFMYSARELIPTFFKSTIENPSSAKRLPFFVEIFQDCDFLKYQAHLLDKNILFDHFKKEVLKNFNESYIIPITRSIEDFLRVNIHTMLIAKIEGINPYKQQSIDIKKLLDVNSIEIFDQNIDIRSEVAQSLNQNFYNINVLNMHDMETYEQMRSLGNFQFDLQLMHVYIPSQTIDQGQMDILQIIRNIPQFVQKYVFNMYNQMFIEITSESKQLSSITIQQISDSIRTHGLGILNSTVNQVYQFILKRINSFSQFLFDDYIHSPLRREYKYFKENNEALDGKYPYERADHFYKEIKRLGQFEDGKNFLDKFRIMITEIGNALGFVRLLRSASLNYCSKSIEFLPSTIPMDLKFGELSKQASMGDTTQQAAEELDDIFTYLRNSFSERTDYLIILVKVFRQLLTKDNKHLEYFYLMIPSLTQNFVETMLLAKERLNKNNPFQAYFCDDGFIVGLSYFLRLLNQIDQFNSLHWKEEIQQYFEKNLQELKQSQDKTPVNKRLAEDGEMQKGLNIRKLNNQQEEYNLFFYAFNSCRILFREDTQ